VALYQNILPLYRDKMALYFRIINQGVTKVKNRFLEVMTSLLKNSEQGK
jgi:hypothetical protein